MGEVNKDRRLTPKDLVVAVGFDEGPKAYPVSILSIERVVNDYAAGRQILLYFDANTGTPVAFNRNVGDKTLTFRCFACKDGEALLVDEETGSKWLPIIGLAIEGELAGTVLERVHAMTVFWFAWSDYYPDTELYGI